ncbi:hypothetical protein EJB05_06860, partial [Eragrostis curvula]
MHIVSHKPIKMHKLVALLLVALAISCGNAAAAAVRMQLIHVDADRGLTPHELMHRMAQRSKARAARFLSEAESAPVTPGQINDGIPATEYLVHFAIGTPPQPVQVEVDTGSDLIWTQCQPCTSCFNQSQPLFDASLSSTFAELPSSSAACQDPTLQSCSTGSPSTGNPCDYCYGYGDSSETIGRLAADTFVFPGGAAVPAIAFGCGLNNSGTFTANETGIAGFGRGPLSLPSQLKVDNFSYCFTTITGTTPSPVLLGVPSNLFGSDPSAVQTTPLIQNPDRPMLYYLSLKGITVGSTMLDIPESTFALTNGTGGTIIDSGTTITSFPQVVYNLVHDAFIAQMSLPVLNSTATPLCFTSSPGTTPDVPKLILHFDGATLDLPPANYMFELEDASASVICLAVNSGGDDMTIIGNFQQQNMHVLYDLANNVLSFAPAQCDMV